ncbi:MAG: sigma-54-dependent Fis family transcriptional regulator [Bacteroidales bacterium]|nr:sigma-54-dependent Fis family transcriptional regulator [Bacteroidales bacterium]
MEDIQSVKQRFGIIGNSRGINRAIEVALQVATTDLSVLITGESGVGKENFPKIIHQYSARKHETYIAVNCGAIPEGTIDSELFGHEKGAFTGAIDSRKGYFEQADKGTIFLDEVAELPLATQARLLRVLESGEFIRVGSSKVQKTNVRVVAATNVKLLEAISIGRFREDLYYRLNTVPINIPPLRDRQEDILLLFKKFSLDFSDKYRMPSVVLNAEAEQMLLHYTFPGNVRQLKNIVEQMSIIEQDRTITVEVLQKYLPLPSQAAVQLYRGGGSLAPQNNTTDMGFERELIFKFLAEMQKDISDLKAQMAKMSKNDRSINVTEPKSFLIDDIHSSNSNIVYASPQPEGHSDIEIADYVDSQDLEAFAPKDNLSLLVKEKELIEKALAKNKGRRKQTALDLGISERTLYRKLKEFGLDKK